MKLKFFLRDLTTRYLPTFESLALRWELRRYPHVHEESGVKILCQVVEDMTYVHRFIHFLLGYQKVTGGSFSLQWILLRNNFQSVSLRKRVTVFLLNNVFTDWLWLAYYRTLGGEVGLRLNQSEAEKNGAADWARSTFKKLESKDQVISLEVDGLLIGDLIYDTYLRFKPAPTVDIQDVFLLELMTWAYDLVKQCREYFEHNKVEVLLTSYTSYIQNGVPVRVALSYGVSVYSMGAYNQLVQKPTLAFPFHKRNFHQYKEFFSQYHSAEEGRSLGHQMIKRRLSGVIDSATSYMAFSSFHKKESQSSVFEESSHPRALVMGHDFYDSPHIYGAMVFSDFYEWICFVFNEAKSSPYEFYYKPHPNGLPDNERINAELKQQFPHVKFLNKMISNVQILEEGVDIVFSVYGTIAHEFAYKGLPVVNAGVNPHEAYSFNICARSREELADYIQGRKNILEYILNKDEVAEFCFVHNYRFQHRALTELPFNFDSKAWGRLFAVKNLPERVAIMAEEIEKCDCL